MFEQRERWLEELRAYTDEKDSVTSTSGRMPWDAIVREIDAACSDARPHGRQHIRDWHSRLLISPTVSTGSDQSS